MNMFDVISPDDWILLLVVHLLLSVVSIYFVIRNEKNRFSLIYSLVILLIPIVGAMAYLFNSYLKWDSSRYLNK
ncbi:PLDc N-terminal domain-containing protein [Marinifilum fragile]|uniref:PLDc N-terminal domain-containing protein n=1 Tax=Marinifilum fragile TaxID=570161 RepID=UPI002AA7DAED|nr:PLDc N-terminal domain-containing protein [Marinifilum fragile]